MFAHELNGIEQKKMKYWNNRNQVNFVKNILNVNIMFSDLLEHF